MISVCLATYNGQKYLKEQIDSILSQIGEKDELIISDDGSIDRTCEIIKSYSDYRIKFIINNGRKGVAYNFENALKICKGDYIFFADQDDVWINNKVTKCLDALQNADLIVHDCYITDSDLSITDNSLFIKYNAQSGFWKNIMHSHYVGACMAFKRKVLDVVLPFPNNLPAYHDSYVASLTDVLGSVTFIPDKLIYYRRHDSNLSPSGGKSPFSLYKKISYRLVWIYLIVLRIFKVRFRRLS